MYPILLPLQEAIDAEVKVLCPFFCFFTRKRGRDNILLLQGAFFVAVNFLIALYNTGIPLIIPETI
jgi:hypothetical protein